MGLGRAAAAADQADVVLEQAGHRGGEGGRGRAAPRGPRASAPGLTRSGQATACGEAPHQRGRRLMAGRQLSPMTSAPASTRRRAASSTASGHRQRPTISGIGGVSRIVPSSSSATSAASSSNVSRTRASTPDSIRTAACSPAAPGSSTPSGRCLRRRSPPARSPAEPARRPVRLMAMTSLAPAQPCQPGPIGAEGVSEQDARCRRRIPAVDVQDLSGSSRFQRQGSSRRRSRPRSTSRVPMPASRTSGPSWIASQEAARASGRTAGLDRPPVSELAGIRAMVGVTCAWFGCGIGR